jgi:biopolymer transport protein ExbB/TolQ
MLGLFGTVVGMIGAFATLATAETVEATALAGDINTALYTTAIGLAIAIPLVLCTASIHVRMRKMEDLVAAGLSRFLEVLRAAMERT